MELDLDNLMVMHGMVSHSVRECSSCEVCIECEKRFKEAVENGELEEILKLSTDN